MKYLLDTNFCIAVLRGQTRAIERLRSVAPDACAVSVITVYELATGVAKCRRPRAEMEKLNKFLGPLSIIPFDENSARQAAIIRASLEQSGTSIGPYDLLLAGQSLAFDLVLVTHNTKEFIRVAGLTFADWEAEPQ